METIDAATQNGRATLASGPPREAIALFRSFLTVMGFDVETPGMRDTPRRYVEALHEMTSGGEPFTFTTFPVEGPTSDQMIVQTDIPVRSLCEHHLLPFVGTAAVAYIPGGDRIVGLSKIVRTVEHFSRRAQVQERLTQEIAQTLDDNLSPRGVAVVIDAEHFCVSLRGACAPGTRTRTSYLTGPFKEDPTVRRELFNLITVNLRRFT